MIFSDILKSIRQFSDPRFLRVLAMGLGLTVLLLLGFYLGFMGLVGWLLPDSFTLPWIGEITWVDTALTWASLPIMLLLSMVLMIPVASVFTGLFLDQIADAVEARHYPSLPPARPIGIIEALRDSVKFLGVMLLANIIALVLYITPLAPFVFWGLNGFLLGREYAQIVALRREGREGAARFRSKNRLTIFLAGVVMVVPLTIPVVNLLVPILGAASFTHIYHRITGSRMSHSPDRNG